MNKNEKQKLAKIIIRMQHGGSATYETISFAEDLLTTFPQIQDSVYDLEEQAYMGKIVTILRSYLTKTINPAMVQGGRYIHTNRLYKNTFDIIPKILEDYLMETEELAEDIFDTLNDNVCGSVITERIRKILESPLWSDCVKQYVDELVEVRYLTGQLEEYSFLREVGEYL